MNIYVSNELAVVLFTPPELLPATLT